MSTNHRSTREIASFEARIVEGGEFVDVEGGPGRCSARKPHRVSMLATSAYWRPRIGMLKPSLRVARFGVVELKSYSGSTAPLVKVGTIKRAKGLEFKQMLIRQVAEELLAPETEGLDDWARERREIERR